MTPDKNIPGTVIITRANSERKLTIGFCFDLSQMVRQLPPDEQLLYCRDFNNLFDAMAHKLMLEEISEDSLYALIRRMNPRMEVLTV